MFYPILECTIVNVEGKLLFIAFFAMENSFDNISHKLHAIVKYVPVINASLVVLSSWEKLIALFEVCPCNALREVDS